MLNGWIIFGGWAVPPDILKSVFGENNFYVDTNLLLPLIIDNDSLKDNWQQILVSFIKGIVNSNQIKIAGWSTGAIVGCVLSGMFNCSKSVFLSATPCFCRTDNFKFGWKKEVLDLMINKIMLTNERQKVLIDFYKKAGFDNFEKKIINKYTNDVLVSGLYFLKEFNLFKIFKGTLKNSIVLHGIEDKIIPYQAGIEFAKLIGGEVKLLKGGHNFFLEYKDEVRDIINL